MQRTRSTRCLAVALGLATVALLAPGHARAERVEFETEDGFILVGELHAGEPAAPALILLHMYRSNRHAFDPLVRRLRTAGYTVLTLDQRAHGESTRRAGGSLRVGEIARGQFGPVLRDGVRDVAAARALLAQRGLGGGGLGLVGASYGCSVSLLATGTVEGISAVVLLSPGAAYFGVDVLPAARAFPGALLGVVAEDDAGSAQGTRAILEAHAGPDELLAYPSGGHGTRLFGSRPEVVERVVEFLAKALPR